MNHLESNTSHRNSIDANAVLWNLPPEERAGKPLLVMMHGLGSHEGDLFGLNRFLPAGLVVASLRAPLEYGGGFAWFQAGEQSGIDTTLLDGSVLGVLDWIDGLEVTPTGVALMGFSQGGCMALQLARQEPARFNYVLQLSGFVANSAHPGDVALAARMPRLPVFWAHGDQDDVIELESVDRTGRWLDEHADAQAHRYPMAHTVSQEELADLVDFVTVRLAS